MQRRRPDPDRRGAIRWPARVEGTVHRPVRERWTGVADPVAPAGHCFGSPTCVLDVTRPSRPNNSLIETIFRF